MATHSNLVLRYPGSAYQGSAAQDPGRLSNCGAREWSGVVQPAIQTAIPGEPDPKVDTAETAILVETDFEWDTADKLACVLRLIEGERSFVRKAYDFSFPGWADGEALRLIRNLMLHMEQARCLTHCLKDAAKEVSQEIWKIKEKEKKTKEEALNTKKNQEHRSDDNAAFEEEQDSISAEQKAKDDAAAEEERISIKAQQNAKNTPGDSRFRGVRKLFLFFNNQKKRKDGDYCATVAGDSWWTQNGTVGELPLHLIYLYDLQVLCEDIILEHYREESIASPFSRYIRKSNANPSMLFLDPLGLALPKTFEGLDPVVLHLAEQDWKREHKKNQEKASEYADTFKKWFERYGRVRDKWIKAGRICQTNDAHDENADVDLFTGETVLHIAIANQKRTAIQDLLHCSGCGCGYNEKPSNTPEQPPKVTVRPVCTNIQEKFRLGRAKGLFFKPKLLLPFARKDSSWTEWVKENFRGKIPQNKPERMAIKELDKKGCLAWLYRSRGTLLENKFSAFYGGETPFHFAAGVGNVEILKDLERIFKLTSRVNTVAFTACLNATTTNSRELQTEVQTKYEGVCATAIGNGVNEDDVDVRVSVIPGTTAAETGKFEVRVNVEISLRTAAQAAEVKKAVTSEQAALNDKLDTKKLPEYSITEVLDDSDFKDEFYNNPLHIAAQQGKMGAFNWIMKQEAFKRFIWEVNRFGVTPLTMMAKDSNLANFQYILTKHFREPIWKWGAIQCHATNLAQVDTYRIQKFEEPDEVPKEDADRKNGEYGSPEYWACKLHNEANYRSALEIIVNRQVKDLININFEADKEEGKLDLNDTKNLVTRMIDEKWNDFVWLHFLIKRLIPYVVFLACFTVLISFRCRIVNWTVLAKAEEEDMMKAAAANLTLEELRFQSEPDWMDNYRIKVWVLEGVTGVFFVYLISCFWISSRLKLQDLDLDMDGKFAFEEIMTFLYTNMPPFLDFFTALSLFCYGIFRIWGPIDWEIGMMVIASVFAWSNTMSLFVPFQFFGLVVITIHRMLVGDVFKILILYVLLVLAFALALFALLQSGEFSTLSEDAQADLNCQGCDENFWTVAKLYVFVSLGEVDQTGLLQTTMNPGIATVLHMMYILLNGVLLLNLIIAMMSSTYTKNFDQIYYTWFWPYADLVLMYDKQNREGVFWEFLNGWRASGEKQTRTRINTRHRLGQKKSPTSKEGFTYFQEIERDGKIVDYFI